MKLLSLPQIKDKKVQEQTREILRIQELNKASDKARENLARAEADFQERLAKNLEIWATEEKDHSDRLEQRKAEIAELDTQKQQTIDFINDTKKNLQIAVFEAQEGSERAKEKEDYCNELSERLQDKLDELGQREVDLLSHEQSLQVQNSAMEQQRELMKENARKLSFDMTTFYTKNQQEEQDIKERKAALFIMDRSLQAREEVNKRTEKELANWAIRLTDEREILTRERKRLSP